MNPKNNWLRYTYITGIVLMIAGAIDPLEGSVIIAAGSVLTAFATYRMNDRHRRFFIACCMSIIFGVCFLFFVSFLGGIGGPKGLSVWWWLPILPYPIGWLCIMLLLIIRWVKKGNSRQPEKD